MNVPALLAAAVLANGPVQAEDRPNIILIVADDLGWGDLGCYPKGAAWGPEAITPTPCIDALAASGVRFTQGYATAMVCAPSRAALLTGKNQQRFGYYGFEDTLAPIPSDLKLLPEALREAGYRTGMFGKWHVSSAAGSWPLDRGFDQFFGFIGGQHDYFQRNIGEKMHGIGRAADAMVYDQDRPAERIGFLTDEFTDRALGFMAGGGRPFFLYLPFNAPHPPMQVPWRDLAPYAAQRADGKSTSRDIARAMIENLDRNVGRIVAWLEEKGLRENTLIVFTSDNGGSDGGPDRVLQHNGGLKGRKSTYYEGGIRVPLILSWPERLPAGEVFRKPVSQLDLFPTFLAAAGSPKVTTQAFDGVNLLPYLNGENASVPHPLLFWCVSNDVAWAIREGDWKLVRDDVDPTTLGGKFRGDAPREYKLQLYDLASDPQETKDVLDDNPDVAARLQKRMAAIRAELAPTLATPEIVAAWKAELAERAKTPALNEARSLPGAPDQPASSPRGAKKPKRPQSQEDPPSGATE